MGVDLHGVVCVILPGTGSDDDYIRRVFDGPLRRAGAVLEAPAPQPRDVVGGYRRALDAAAAAGPIVVGGVSLGAAVATAWALQHPTRTLGVLAALPAWTGKPGEAPAALSARHTAELLRRDGLDAVTAAMRESSPGWLGDELARSWARQWPALPEAMLAAAAYRAPDTAALGRLNVPMGVAGAPDDAVHPLEVARHWAHSAPRAALATVTLEEFGPDPERLGAACLAALQQAART